MVDDWSTEVRTTIEKAIQDQLSDQMGYLLITPEQDAGRQSIRLTKKNLDDIHALYRAVSVSILLHTSGGIDAFPEKVNSFDYSLGPVVQELSRCPADALLFVWAEDEISSAGRVGLQTLGIILSIPLSVAVRQAVYIGPRFGKTLITAAPVEPKTGDVCGSMP